MPFLSSWKILTTFFSIQKLMKRKPVNNLNLGTVFSGD